MGFWGPTIRTRLVDNRQEWYGTCETCKQEHTGRSEGAVKRQMNACEAELKKAKREQEREAKREKERAAKEAKREASRKAERERKEEERYAKRKAFKDKQDAEKKEREQKAKYVRDALIKTKRQVKAAKKGGKCPFCRKTPCNNSRPQCSQVTAAGLQSVYDMLDTNDPGRFDPGLKWARDNLDL